MRIVHFTWEFPPLIYGGLGTFASELALQQKKKGNNVSVYSLNKENEYDSYSDWKGIDVYRPKTIDLDDVFYLFSDRELKSWGSNFGFFSDVINYNVTSAIKSIERIKDRKNVFFDIVDVHDWLGVLSGIALKKELDIPLIFHIHSTEVGRSLGRGSHIIKDIEFEGGQVADGIITVSHAMKDELEKLGFPSEKINVCWNGIDPKKYKIENVSIDDIRKLKERYGIDPKENLLFFIGRLVSVKGIDKLVKAMPMVLDENPDTKLLILGIGDMLDDLKRLAEDLDVRKNIIFRDEFVDEEERIIHYAASDVVVLPSIYEPFGIVCTEAMSMSKPVVVGARGTNGFREQVIPKGEKQNGFHVDGSSPSDIAWGINEVLSFSDKGKKLGLNGRKRVEKLFSWEKVAQRTEEIYKKYL
ncbi:MAG: glycosyltransferase family 4 protein [Candidatus Thermoplasmatota archaeon]